MKKILLLIAIAICFIELTGCASNAAASKMVYKPQVVTQPKNQHLINGIVVDQVIGGTETNPLWVSKVNNDGFKAALEQSLRESNLYNDSSKNKYVLNAALKQLKQPFFGTDFTVTCIAHYSLIDFRTNKLLYDKDIKNSYTAKFNDSLIAMIRLKLANEGAVRDNIELLINDLEKLPAK